MLLDGYIYNSGGGNIDILNQGKEGAKIAGVIENETGDINIDNYTKALEFAGEITAKDGDINIKNNGENKLAIYTPANINTLDGDIKISNTSTEGIDIQGIVKADKILKLQIKIQISELVNMILIMISISIP